MADDPLDGAQGRLGYPPAGHEARPVGLCDRRQDVRSPLLPNSDSAPDEVGPFRKRTTEQQAPQRCSYQLLRDLGPRPL